LLHVDKALRPPSGYTYSRVTNLQSETLPPIGDDYTIPAGSRDELLDDAGRPLAHARPLMAALARLGPDALDAAGKRRDAIFMQQGITFEVAGSDGERRDRAWPLDLVPRVLTSAEWTTIKRGLAQRIRALNAFVDDVYHAHEIVRAGIVPWSLIVSRPSFARPVHGVRAPGGVYCHVCGCDLVRDGGGTWRVLEDNVRTPSGISYVLENRVAMTRLVPELFAGHRVRGVEHYPSLLLDALRSVAPAAESHPTVVLWTPGAMNSAYFEHAFLARQMGVELVEPTDLVVRDAVCYMRTTAGLQRVHTIYRRLDDDFIDPLEFRPDSLLGVPGLVRAYRAGTVAIANAIGTGVADDKAIYCFVPEMIRFYLGEEPILENVPTYLLSDERARKHVLSRLDQVVVKPTSESGGKGRVHRAARQRGRARAPGPVDRARSRPVHRPGARAPVDRADRDGRRSARPAARRPAPVRGVRRGDPDRPRRPDPGRAARGLDDRQLLPGRRLEGHVGARRRGRRRPCAGNAAGAASAAPARRALRRRLGTASLSNNSSRCWRGLHRSCSGWGAI
jgi:uncharacterized circularly permuted ATP-grasp superfamily protein